MYPVNLNQIGLQVNCFVLFCFKYVGFSTVDWFTELFPLPHAPITHICLLPVSWKVWDTEVTAELLEQFLPFLPFRRQTWFIGVKRPEPLRLCRSAS